MPVESTRSQNITDLPEKSVRPGRRRLRLGGQIAYQRSLGLDAERSSAFVNLIGDEQNWALNRHKKEPRAI
jgi:hypothetical protein